jgi:hypothetical protein
MVEAMVLISMASSSTSIALLPYSMFKYLLTGLKVVGETRTETEVQNHFISFIQFPVGSQLEHRAPLGVSMITHTLDTR